MEGQPMKFRTKRAVSLEAIRHLADPDFKEKLLAAAAKLHTNKNYSRKDIEESGLEQIVAERFGYNIELQVIESPAINAYVIPPDLSKNHTMFDANRRSWASGEDALKFLKANKVSALTGTYDRATGRITGDFTKLVSKIVIFTGTLRHPDIHPENVAALFAHEVGHIQTYFENLDRLFTTNLVLAAVASGFLGTDSGTTKYELIREGGKQLGLKSVDTTDVANITDPDVAVTVLINASLTQPESILGSAIHDFNAWEQGADQFVSRLGLSLALGRTLDVIGTVYGDLSKMGIVTWGLLNTFMTAVVMVYSPIIIPVMLLSNASPDANYYDNLPNRIRRIQQDAKSALKNAKLSTEDTKRVLNDIDGLNALIQPLKEREFFFSKIFRLCSGTFRSQKQIMDRQKMYEELANNNLFVHAARLRTIGAENLNVAVADITFEDGTEGSTDLFDQYDTLYKHAEKLRSLSNEPSLENHKEREAALEESMAGLVVASILALAGLFYHIWKFFQSSDVEGKAEEWVTTIKRNVDDKPEIVAEDVDNSDTMKEHLGIPAVATAFDPNCAPKTARLIDSIDTLIDKLSKRTWLKHIDNIDHELDRIDKMSDEDRASEIDAVEEDYKDFMELMKDIDALGAELKVTPPELNGNAFHDGKAKVKFYNACITAAGSYQQDLKMSMATIHNLDWSKTLTIATETQSKIAKFNAFSEKSKDISDKLKAASKKLKGLDHEKDAAVKHLKVYVDLNQAVAVITLKLGKLLITRLKGQRDVVNLLDTLSKQPK